MQALRGMKDLLPKQMREHQHITQVASRICEGFNYGPIQTPILEKVQVFERSAAQSEVVQKEMYAFQDKVCRSIVMIVVLVHHQVVLFNDTCT